MLTGNRCWTMKDIREGCSDRGPFPIRKTYYNLLETRKGKRVCCIVQKCVTLTGHNGQPMDGCVRTNSISPLVQFIFGCEIARNSKCSMSEVKIVVNIILYVPITCRINFCLCIF